MVPKRFGIATYLRNGWNNPDHEFIDPELEQKRKKLLEAVGDSWTIYGQQTFVVKHDPERSEVPRELREMDEANMWRSWGH